MVSERTVENCGVETPDLASFDQLLSMGRLLLALRHYFQGDLDVMLILLTILTKGWRNGAPKVPSAQPYIEVLPLPMNTSVISKVTGIPRETVRRKLEIMRQRRWLLRGSEGKWSVTTRAREDLHAAVSEISMGLRDGVTSGHGPHKPTGLSPE